MGNALETNLRKNMQQKDEASRLTDPRPSRGSRDLIARLTDQAEAHKVDAQQWEAESEKKARAAIEPLNLKKAVAFAKHAKYAKTEGVL
jgi:hypothetical protein